LDSNGVNGGSELSYKRTPIPTPQEVACMAAELISVDATGPVDVAYPVDMCLRFALLAYARNNAGVRYHFLESLVTGEVEAIEVQLHGTDDFRAGAHAALYIYRLKEGGVEVVLSYKGSTLNVEDWAHNLCFVNVEDDMSLHLGTPLFSDVQDASENVQNAKVHTGFQAYKRSLDDRMKGFSMEPLLELLHQWGAATEHGDLYSWLHSRGASWKRCTVVGHSLGGAMAAMAAVELAIRGRDAQGRGKTVMLTTFAAPAAGNEAFVALQNELVGPCGGLRIYNKGDTVPMLGYKGVAVRPTKDNLTGSKYHGGLKVPLWGKAVNQVDPYHIHLRFTVPSDVNLGIKGANSSKAPQRQWVTCKFPGTTYKPSATDDFIEYTLGNSWRIADGGEQEVVERRRVVDPRAAMREAKETARENSRAVTLAAKEFAAFSSEALHNFGGCMSLRKESPQSTESFRKYTNFK